MLKRLVNRTGERHGRLVVLDRAANGSGSNARWRCQCDCGNETVVFAMSLVKGTTKSCGCYHRESAAKLGAATVRHGAVGTRTYRIWAGILTRCTNAHDPNFKNYGARGIIVCDRWRHSFENFLADMGACPAGLTIERKDNNANYEPGNCRWATYTEQAGNRRNNRLITYNGETRTLAEWARLTGVKRCVISYRIGAGWPLWRALQPQTSATPR